MSLSKRVYINSKSSSLFFDKELGGVGALADVVDVMTMLVLGPTFLGRPGPFLINEASVEALSVVMRVVDVKGVELQEVVVSYSFIRCLALDNRSSPSH